MEARLEDQGLRGNERLLLKVTWFQPPIYLLSHEHLPINTSNASRTGTSSLVAGLHALNQSNSRAMPAFLSSGGMHWKVKREFCKPVADRTFCMPPSSAALPAPPAPGALPRSRHAQDPP